MSYDKLYKAASGAHRKLEKLQKQTRTQQYETVKELYKFSRYAIDHNATYEKECKSKKMTVRSDVVNPFYGPIKLAIGKPELDDKGKITNWVVDNDNLLNRYANVCCYADLNNIDEEDLVEWIKGQGGLVNCNDAARDSGKLPKITLQTPAQVPTTPAPNTTPTSTAPTPTSTSTAPPPTPYVPPKAKPRPIVAPKKDHRKIAYQEIQNLPDGLIAELEDVISPFKIDFVLFSLNEAKAKTKDKAAGLTVTFRRKVNLPYCQIETKNLSDLKPIHIKQGQPVDFGLKYGALDRAEYLPDSFISYVKMQYDILKCHGFEIRDTAVHRTIDLFFESEDYFYDPYLKREVHVADGTVTLETQANENRDKSWFITQDVLRVDRVLKNATWEYVPGMCLVATKKLKHGTYEFVLPARKQ